MVIHTFNVHLSCYVYIKMLTLIALNLTYTLP